MQTDVTCSDYHFCVSVSESGVTKKCVFYKMMSGKWKVPQKYKL